MHQLYAKLHLILLFFLLAIFPAFAQKPFTITKDSTYIPLATRVEILEDASRNLTLQQILQKPHIEQFKPSQSMPFHGYSLSNYWFRFAVEAKKLPFGEEWFVQIHNPNIDTIEIFFLNEKNEIIQQYQTGDKFPFYQRPVTYYKFLFPIPFEKVESLKIYICLKGYYIKNHNLDLAEKKTLLNIGQTTLSFFIFLKAILFTLLIYNVLLLLSLRDITYLYYVAYLFFSSMYFLAIDGFAFRILYAYYPILTSYVASTAGVFAEISLLWFAYYFLNIPLFWSSAKIVIRGVGIFGMLLLGLMFAGVWQLASIPLLLIIFTYVIFGLFLTVFLAWVALRQKTRQALFFIFASSFFFFGTIILFIRRLIIPIPELIGDNAFQLGILIQGFLFSFALADRIKIANRERNQAQQLAITALQKNEAMIKEQNQLLEQKVKERTSELQEKQEEIEQQNTELNEKSVELEKLNATKDKLFGIIGHDLRSPINSLKGLMDMLANQYISAEEFVMFSGKLRNGVEHAHFTLNNLLEWANTQLKGLVADPIMTNVAELGEENFNFLGQLAAAKEIALDNQIAPDLEAYIDPDQINLVFRNLISNAIKFTPEKGSITLKSAIEADFCKISIIDTGVGMSPENAAKLFNKTTHFTTYGTSGEKGTGLGLLLCQEMVEKNGGQIWVESQLGQGTSFNFTLPHKNQ
jgi:signal transduction histidine kinase